MIWATGSSDSAPAAARRSRRAIEALGVANRRGALIAGDPIQRIRRLAVGVRVLIYASSPTQHVTGWFDIGGVIADRPAVLWEMVRDRAGVSRTEFRAYFAGCELAHAIEITAAERVSPMALDMCPPQSWQYLHAANRRHRGLLSLAV